MFFSVNDPGFAEVHEDLVRFVLNRDLKGLAERRYGIHMTLIRGGRLRAAGIGVLTDLERHDQRVVTEVASPPFAFLLSIDSPPFGIGDISGWSTYGFDERAEPHVTVHVGEIHTPFHGDYRTEEEVERQARGSLTRAAELRTTQQAPRR